jgi:hypothetical protein
MRKNKRKQIDGEEEEEEEKQVVSENKIDLGLFVFFSDKIHADV